MLSPKVVFLERELASLLLTISRMEANIEEQRINLAENDKFNAEDAFEKIDHNNHGYLLISDFTYFFSANHLPVLERECHYIFDFYSNDQGKKMTFNNFLKMVTPVTNGEVRDRFLRRAATRKKKMPFFLVDQLAQLIQKELDFFLKTETLKMNLMHTYGWNTLKAFALIDRMSKGYIDYKDVAKLIEKIGERFTEEDYRALARRLDHDLNERITKNEFCEALLPNDVSREDLEIRHATFLEKEPDYFYNPVKTIKKVSELQLTEKRKFLNQNVNLMNQNCDNVFAGDEELKHIRAFIRNQDDVMDFATENFYRQSKSVRPMNPPEEFNKINTSNIYKNPVINTNDLNLEKTTMHSKDRMIKEGPILQNTQALYNKQQLIQTNLENSDVFRYSQSQKNNTSLFRSSPKKIFEIKDPKNNPTKKETDQLAQSLNEIKNGSLRNSSVRPSLKLNNSKFSHLFQTK